MLFVWSITLSGTVLALFGWSLTQFGTEGKVFGDRARVGAGEAKLHGVAPALQVPTAGGLRSFQAGHLEGVVSFS